MRHKKLWKRITALAMASAMLLAGAGCNSKKEDDSEQKGQQDDGKEQANESETDGDTTEIEVTVWANCLDPVQGLGAQYNPIADKIAEETGVRINVFETSNNSSQNDQLAVMRAANDLPDIMYVPDMNTMNELIEAGQVLELSDYWNAEELPNLAGEDAIGYGVNNFVADQKLDGKRYVVNMWTGTGSEEQPTVGLYVPWEIYKKVGYPEVNSLDDFVDALAAMNEVYSETADGQKVYGTGAWFAEDGSWGRWCVNSVAYALGYISDSFAYTFDMTTNDLMETCSILDPDSIYWQVVEFWYNMNQRGLVDQDSITQKADQYEEKAYSGRYIFTLPSWGTNSQKLGANMSWVALKPFGDAMVLDWSGETSGDMYAISSSCENPEAALKLLDYLCSPEGARVAFSGIEGEAWEMVDGKAQYTEQYKADANTLTDLEMVEKYGGKLGHFTGYVSNSISPVDNSYYDLKSTPEYRAETFTEAEQDAFDYYGVDSLREIYTENCINVKIQVSEYTANMDLMPDDLQKNETDLNSFVERNYLSCIFASDDTEFEAQKQAIIDGAADYNAEGLFEWYKEEFSKTKAVIDPYLP